MNSVFKFLLGSLVFSVTLLVIIGAGAFWWTMEEFDRAGPLDKPTLIVINRGTSLGGIADILSRCDAIKEPYIFALGTKITGQQGNLKAGEYELQPGMSPRKIMEILKSGKIYRRSFTIREGLTSFEIVELLRRVEKLEGVITDIPAEGALLPETYDYQSGETRNHIIARLKKSMTSMIEELWVVRSEGLPVSSPEEAIILASIVEKETGISGERRRVAGVFINRLRKGIKLQTDPTVIYALTNGRPENEGKGPLGRRILKKDLEFDSPYNTYLHYGLPPGPIANPGQASIEAVLNPEKHEYIYFVADGTGGHVFAKTLDEHNRNVAHWRRIRRTQIK